MQIEPNKKIEIDIPLIKDPTVGIRKQLYKQFVPKGYNPQKHLLIALSLFLAFIIVPWFLIDAISFRHLAAFAGFLFVGNLYVYFLHRFPQHRRIKPLQFFHKVHTIHHLYYPHDSNKVDSQKDYFFIVFPVSFILFYGLVFIPINAYLLSLFLGGDIALIFYSAGNTYFFLHELVHFFCHSRYLEKK